MPSIIRPRIETMFQPTSLAIVGASMREGSAGLAIYNNVAQAGFEGRIGLVNPRYKVIDGRTCVARLDDLDFVPDIVVIATPPKLVLPAAEAAAARGTAAALVVTMDARPERALARSLSALVKRTGMRVVGPNCVGLIVPAAKLNISLAAMSTMPGDLALVSQSGAVASALIAWANAQGVGFSSLVATTDMVDVDFARFLDHFAVDPNTRAILLFVEEIGDVQTFMSAARAAARAKPVIVLKASAPGGTTQSSTHARALADADAVFDAACRRAGLLRVREIDGLFDAAEALGRIKPFRGHRLAIVSNGAGIGDLAADRLRARRGVPARFSEDTYEALRSLLPPEFTIRNPLDIGGDATPARLGDTLDVVLADSGVDAVVAIHAPTALSHSVSAAQAVAESVARASTKAISPKPVFAVWYGASDVTDRIFESAHIPHYTRGVIPGFLHVVHWAEAREFLMSAPPSLPDDFDPDVTTARAIVREALTRAERSNGSGAPPRVRLRIDEAARLFEAYAIPVAPARFAESPEEAAELARFFIARAGACVLKIASPDVDDRSSIGGIVLDLQTPDAVAQAARAMLDRVAREQPGVQIDGLTVHPMIRRPQARELYIGLADDRTFGPIVVFGQGGKAVQVIRDVALALPPLDLSLAHDLIRRTHVARVLQDYRDVQRVDMDALALTLVKIAQIAADIPEIREIDLNPLLADSTGLIAVDARVFVSPESEDWPSTVNRRFAVAPYPKEQEVSFTLRDGTLIFVRPARPDDEDVYRAFFEAIPQEDLRLRFFSPVRDFSHAFLARLAQVDYARVYAVIAFQEDRHVMVGGVRLVVDPARTHGEYAILVSPSMKGRGLGYALMVRMIEAARSLNLDMVEGYVLAENDAMLRMCRSLGFTLDHAPHERGVVKVQLLLGGGVQHRDAPPN
jgi:acetyltransferase